MPRMSDPVPLADRPTPVTADRDQVVRIIAAAPTRRGTALAVHKIEDRDDGKLQLQLSSGVAANDAIRMLRVHGYDAEWAPKGERGFRADAWIAVAGRVSEAA